METGLTGLALPRGRKRCTSGRLDLLPGRRPGGLDPRLNLLLLLPVVFLPFPTRLLADSLHNTSGERVFATLYGLTLLAIRVLGSALGAYARHEDLYSRHEDSEEPHADHGKLLPIVPARSPSVQRGV